MLFITLHPVNLTKLPAVAALRVAEEQLAYVGTPEQMLAEAERIVGLHAFAVCAAESPVGFLMLNFDPGSTRHYRAPQGVGLEGFFIDAAQQGRGYGKAALAAVLELLAREHPDVRSIDLTVNTKNAAAIRTYLSAGFEDTGELYTGGRSGPQHVFRRKRY